MTSGAKYLMLTLCCSIMMTAACDVADSMDGQAVQADETLQKVLERNRDAIMAMPNVIGVGIGKCDPGLCIRVMVSERSVGLDEQLGELLQEHPYTIEETEPFQTLPSAREP